MFYIDHMGRADWVGDGFCDDINNNRECYYDNGDCCGCDVQIQYCIDCTCQKTACKYLSSIIIIFNKSNNCHPKMLIDYICLMEFKYSEKATKI